MKTHMTLRLSGALVPVSAITNRCDMATCSGIAVYKRQTHVNTSYMHSYISAHTEYHAVQIYEDTPGHRSLTKALSGCYPYLP